MTVWKNYVDDHRVTVSKAREKKPRNPREARQMVEAIVSKDPGAKIKVIGSGHSASPVAKPAEYMFDISGMKRLREPNKNFLSATAAKAVEDGRLVEVDAGISIKKLNIDLAARDCALMNMGGYDAQTIIGALCTGTHGSGFTKPPIADGVRAIEMIAVEKGRRLPGKKGKRGGHEAIVKHYRIEPGTPSGKLLKRSSGTSLNRSTGEMTRKDSEEIRLGRLTDRKAFEAAADRHEMELIQDNDIFYSVVLGIGTMGVVTRLIIEVENKRFFLRETYDSATWAELKAKDRAGVPRIMREAREHEFYQVYVNMLFVDRPIDDAVCLITKRKRVPAGKRIRDKPPNRESGVLEQVVLAISNEAPAAVARVTSRKPKIFRDLMDDNFRKKGKQRVRDAFVSQSDKVLITGFAAPADSNEIHVPFKNTIRAVEVVLDAAKEWEQKKVYHNSPIGIRFVAPSKHYLSMGYKMQTTTIELPLLKGTPSRVDRLAKKLFGALSLFFPSLHSRKQILKIYERIESRLYGLGGRPHWGQRHFIKRRRVAEMYPKFKTWHANYKRFNALGTFDNEFTEEVGF